MEAYRKEVQRKCEEQISNLLTLLPSYCTDFDLHRADTRQPRTRLANLQDIKVFFSYLKVKNPLCTKLAYKDIPLEYLEQMTILDFDDYKRWLKSYTYDDRYYENDLPTIKRKLSSLKAFYKYLYAYNFINSDPCSVAELPVLKKKQRIKVMDSDDRAIFFQTIDRCYQNAVQNLEDERNAIKAAGKGLLRADVLMLPYVILRNRMIIQLFLCSGLRISELVAIDVQDIKLDRGTINIIRKGGNIDKIYLSDDCVDALLEYIDDIRPQLEPVDTDALFISQKHNRLSVRSIENMMKVYCDLAFGTKHGYTPHKLRATFGTEFYRQTSDIKATAAVLGHSNIQTTSDYYASDLEEFKMQAKYINLLPNQDK